MESVAAAATAVVEETAEDPGVVCPATALALVEDVEAADTPGVEVPLGVLP